MNPVSVCTGAIGAGVRSLLGYLRNRKEAKDKQVEKPSFNWGRLIESMIEGGMAGMLDPEPITAGVVGYFGSDVVGKTARLTPLRHVLPTNHK
ncbi:hypothetical protein J7M28_09960 [bacterium]|nr:hypothetical protein [bacterium]